jgi:hypothetical protein
LHVRIPAPSGAQHEMKKTIIIWFVLVWAIVSGCFVTDLFVCPWTAVFHQEKSQVQASTIEQIPDHKHQTLNEGSTARKAAASESRLKAEESKARKHEKYEDTKTKQKISGLNFVLSEISWFRVCASFSSFPE